MCLTVLKHFGELPLATPIDSDVRREQLADRLGVDRRNPERLTKSWFYRRLNRALRWQSWPCALQQLL